MINLTITRVSIYIFCWLTFSCKRFADLYFDHLMMIIFCRIFFFSTLAKGGVDREDVSRSFVHALNLEGGIYIYFFSLYYSESQVSIIRQIWQNPSWRSMNSNRLSIVEKNPPAYQNTYNLFSISKKNKKKVPSRTNVYFGIQFWEFFFSNFF